jgi:hypothetical protein
MACNCSEGKKIKYKEAIGFCAVVGVAALAGAVSYDLQL